MPRPADPNRRDFYVYSLTAAGYPYYVGVGRGKRAGDRERWVRSQMARERRGLRPKWVRHTLVMAELIEKGVPIKHRLLETRLTRDEALAYERAAIARYLKRGVVLANYQHNRAFKGTVADVAGDLMRKMGMARGHDRRAAV